MATPDTPTKVEQSAPVVPPESDYDTMASAFDELTTPESSENGETDESTEQVEGEASSSEPPAEPEAPAAATPPAAAASTPPEDSTAAGEPPTAPADDAEEVDWKKRFEELEAKVTKQAAPEPQQKDPEVPPPEQQKVYTEEEEAFLAQYDQDWKEVARGESLKRRAEYAAVVQHVFSEIARVYGPLIQRGSTAADLVGETAALNVIYATHEDYDDAMYSAVNEWVDKKLTGTRQKVAKAIIEAGEPEEVVELITEFKTATGRTNKSKVTAEEGVKPAAAAPAAPVAPVTEISSKAKQAAKAMSVVDSKRTAPLQSAADPDDFDSAWAEAVGSK